MPKRIKKICGGKYCNEVSRGLYCEKCAEAKAKAIRSRKRSYDDTRPSAAKRGYGRAWQVASKNFLCENPTCNECGRLAGVVDHITPHKANMVLFWDCDNWQSLCKPCHDAKTAREDSNFSGGGGVESFLA